MEESELTLRSLLERIPTEGLGIVFEDVEAINKLIESTETDELLSLANGEPYVVDGGTIATGPIFYTVLLQIWGFARTVEFYNRYTLKIYDVVEDLQHRLSDALQQAALLQRRVAELEDREPDVDTNNEE